MRGWIYMDKSYFRSIKPYTIKMKIKKNKFCNYEMSYKIKSYRKKTSLIIRPNVKPIPKKSIVKTTKKMLSVVSTSPSSEYCTVIDDHFRNREKLFPLKPYMDGTERNMIIDSMIAVYENCKMNRDVFHLSIHIMDRYLVKKYSSFPEKVYLVSLTCIFIASKYLEDEYVYIDDILYATDPELDECSETYQDLFNSIVKMEAQILKELGFDIGIGTVNHFLNLYIEVDKEFVDIKQINLARYLCDLALSRSQFLKYVPSLIAASALRVSKNTHNFTWSQQLILCSGYTEKDTQKCCEEMLDAHNTWGKYIGVYDKYNSKYYQYASKTVLKI